MNAGLAPSSHDDDLQTDGPHPMASTLSGLLNARLRAGQHAGQRDEHNAQNQGEDHGMADADLLYECADDRGADEEGAIAERHHDREYPPPAYVARYRVELR